MGAAYRRLRPPPGPDALRARPADVAGSVLARLTVLPALLILAWLIPAVPLLLAGHFLPVPQVLISVPLAVALIVNGLRVVPATWPRLVPRGRTAEAGWTTWFGLLATVAVVAGLISWQLAEGSEALIVVRDPGTLLQAGFWVAQHGSVPIPQTIKAFGGPHSGLTFTSTGFLARGSSVYPAAMPGLPLLLAGGFWVHGITGILAIGPIFGGLAALAFAGLVARLVGPQWAPGGALLLGLSLPQQYVGRTALTETALQIMIFGGLCLLTDALVLRGVPAAVRRATDSASGTGIRERLAAWRFRASLVRPGVWLTPPRMLAGLAGLALSFGLVLSLDSVVYLLPVIPFGCVLAAGRRPEAATFLFGSAVGLCYGAASAYLLARPFLDTIGEAARAGRDRRRLARGAVHHRVPADQGCLGAQVRAASAGAAAAALAARIRRPARRGGPHRVCRATLRAAGARQAQSGGPGVHRLAAAAAGAAGRPDQAVFRADALLGDLVRRPADRAAWRLRHRAADPALPAGAHHLAGSGQSLAGFRPAAGHHLRGLGGRALGSEHRA